MGYRGMSLLEMVWFRLCLFCFVCFVACFLAYLFACLLLHKDTLAIHGYYMATDTDKDTHII